jgi:arylsulfatase A
MARGAFPRHDPYTPTYSSWLNQVEIWFALIQRVLIERGIFTSRHTMRIAREISRAALLIPLILGAAACVPPESSAGDPSPPNRPPNFVFIMADDLGYGDIEPYGQTKIQTPSLSRMAEEGMLFTQFYSASTVCAPARSSLMTGQHTGRTPIRGNKEIMPIGQEPLPAGTMTVAGLLQQAGYVTGIFGKWGLGYPGSEGVPTRHGFDEFYGYLDQRRAHHFYPEFLFRDEEREVLVGNRVMPKERTVGSGWPIEREIYSHDAIAEEALSFIERHRERPFFLYVPFTIPHADLDVPEDAYAPYLDANGESIFEEVPHRPTGGSGYSPQERPRATYAAMVTRLDRDVGRILDTLAELGLDENTIVFFTSDNGPLRGYKRDLYEGGIRVPMLVRWPGRVPAGSTSDHVWTLWDVLPTLAGLAGARAPDGIDGLDMTNAFTRGGPAPQHEHLYWEFHEQGGKQAVRMGDWKAVRLDVIRNPRAPTELYDLSTDLAEEHDVAAQHPEIVREMEAIMVRERTASELFPALNGVGAHNDRT